MGYLYAQALRAVGVPAYAIAQKKRRTRRTAPYDEYVKHPERLWRLLTDHDIIVWMHSNFIPLKPILKTIEGKRLAVFHGGSNYRNDPEEMNKIFNRRVFVSLIQTPNLLHLGAKNEKWIMPPVDTKKILPRYINLPEKGIWKRFGDLKSNIIIAHHPSSPDTKNTDEILETMDRMMADPSVNGRFEFVHKKAKVSWEKNLRRLYDCDIYIESLSRQINGKETNGWGVTALEAAASGCMVFSTFGHKEEYESEYGPCPINKVSNGQELERELRRFILEGPTNILNEQRASRKWAQTVHSPRAIGKQLKEALEL
jgi:hypothetical protein